MTINETPKPYGYIYGFKIHHYGDTYYYIGKTKNLVEQRINRHRHDLRTNEHRNNNLQIKFDTIYLDTGVEPTLDYFVLRGGNFTKCELDKLESLFIKKYKEQYGDYCLNIYIGNDIPDELRSEDGTTIATSNFQERLELYNKRIEKFGTFKESKEVSFETSAILSIRAKLQHSDPEFKEKHRTKIKASWEDEERRKEHGDRVRQRFENEAVREAHGKRMREVLSDPKLRLKLTINNPRSRPVTVEGITYASVRQAVRETGLSKDKLRILAREQNPEWSGSSSKKKEVVLDGVKYESIAEAARQLGISKRTVGRRLKKQNTISL